jgi:hypothetical protein
MNQDQVIQKLKHLKVEKILVNFGCLGHKEIGVENVIQNLKRVNYNKFRLFNKTHSVVLEYGV